MTTTQVIANLPWQEIFDWLAAVGIPTLIALWRKQVSNSSRSSKLLAVVIQGVEEAAQAIGTNGSTVKRAIRNKSMDEGLDLHLDKVVQEITK